MNTPTDNLLGLMRSRRSIRRYQAERTPSEAQVALLMEAACWAPSPHNRQPWRFAVIQTQGVKASLAAAMGARLRADLERDGAAQAVIDADVQRSYARLTNAPLLIAACLSMAEMDTYPDARRQGLERWMAAQGVAMAAQNLLLMAHALGLGACWLCAPLFCQDAVQQVLDLPADWEPQGLISVGWPAETKEKGRFSAETRVLYR